MVEVEYAVEPRPFLSFTVGSWRRLVDIIAWWRLIDSLDTKLIEKANNEAYKGPTAMIIAVRTFLILDRKLRRATRRN